MVSEAFEVGENVLITVSNRPWLDMSIPPESNDYMSAQSATIKIYGPCDELLMESNMCEMADRPGWYYFTYQTTEECNKAGLHRVIVELGCLFPVCGGATVCTTGSTGTSGTSGTPDPETGVELVTSRKVGHFRLIDNGVS